MKSNPVAWFEIYVQDINRAKTFYEQVFQFKLEKLGNPNDECFPDMEMYSFPASMETYGSSGALVKMPGCPSGPGGTMVYFSCEDCGVRAKDALANGGKIFKDKMAIGEHGFIAIVFDTEGNMIGLHSMQ